jgi:hypothetical protein
MDVHRHGSVLGLTALALVLACGSAWAQATATISGTARDQSGAVLPGVTITVTQQETSLVRTTVTNETGSYVLPNLPLGPYRLEAMLQGFATFAQGGIVLQVNASPVVNPVMGVSAIAEEVQVTGAAPLVDTRSTGVGTVVELQRVVELPLNARQTAQLITLSGLAVQTASSPAFSMNTGVRISVAGGNDYGVSYSLDGAPHLNNFDGTGMHLPFPAALQEFRIATGAQEAGGTIRAGASVSAVTKSGTNAFHGEAFEFARDSRFNAGDFLSGKEGRAQAQSVRRPDRRPDCPRQGVLLRGPPNHDDPAKSARSGGVRAHRGHVDRRFHRVRIRCLQRRPGHRAWRAVCGQPYRCKPPQPGSTQYLAPAAQAD